MSEIFSGMLSFVSASLVALIALSFGVLLVFFSGSAVLVLGQFVPFARSPRVAAISVGLVVLGIAATSAAAGLEPVWGPPVLWAFAGGAGYAALRLPSTWRPGGIGVGLVFLVTGLLYVASIFDPELTPWAQNAILATLLVGTLALAAFIPLFLGGLVQHVRTRSVEWFISIRYLVAKRRQTFLSIITVICVLGVALGVAVITVVLSVMNGFAHVWEDKIVGNRAHLVVQSSVGTFGDYDDLTRRIRDVSGVLGVTPVVMGEAVLRGEGGQIQGVLLKGIDPATVAEATELRNDLIMGSVDTLEPDPDATDVARYPGVVIGAQLADRFFLRVNDPVILISPLGGPLTPLGPAPRMERFRVAGIFRANFFQFDETFVYTSLRGAQHFLKFDDVVTGIEVRTDDPYRSRAVGREVSVLLEGPFYVQDWKEFYPGFFQALKTERAMMFVLLSFIMVVAGFIIVATLIMTIMEKSRDIAILKTMGCEDGAILRIFAIGGALTGVVGLILGLAMGLIITWNLDTIQWVVERTLGFDVLPADVYQLQELPFHVLPEQLALVSVIALTLSIGATLLPSWQASRLDPAEALRHE